MLRTIRDPEIDPGLRAQRLCAIAVAQADALCTQLPGGWKPIPSGLYQAAIGADDGRQLTITATTGAKGEDRLKVGTRFDGSLSPYTSAHWEIGVSLSKRAEIIAREIERRLLPDLNAELARVQAARSAEEARKSHFNQTMTLLEQTLPALRPHPAHFSTRVVEDTAGLRGEFMLHSDGNSGEVQLREVPIGLLAAICQTIAEHLHAA